MQWSRERVDWDALGHLPPKGERDRPLGLHCGSLWGRIREIVGLVGLSYLMTDDPDLVGTILEATAEICYQGTKAILEQYDDFDFAHFWEDICYRAGPLVNPRVFLGQGRAPLPPDHRASQLSRNPHRIFGLRRQH